MSRRKFVQGAAAAGVGGLVLGGLTGYGAARVTESGGGGTGSVFGPIKIGAALPLTGWAAADGQEMKRGLEMAVEEAKARGDVGGDITLSILDVENMGPEIVTNAFRRLIDQEKVDAIIIGYVVGTGPEYDIVAEAGIPYLHVNTYETTAQLVRQNPDKYWMIFQGDPTEIWYGSGLPVFIEALVESGRWEPANSKAVVITSDNPYSITIAELFIEGAKQLGWDIPVYEQVVTPVADWGPVIAKIRQVQPALIVNTNYTPSDLATFTKEIVADPPPALLYEQYGPSVPEFLELAGDAAEGVLWSTVIGVLPDQMANDWRQRYLQRFGEPPGFSNAGSEYDMVNIYLRAVAMAGGPKDRRRVCEYIKSMIHRGVCGTYSFTTPDNTVPTYPAAVKDPSLAMPHLYFQIQDGRHRVIGPDPYIEAEFRLPPWLRS
jgi:branched-chain amino acid transport system substrate-binding protein